MSSSRALETRTLAVADVRTAVYEAGPSQSEEAVVFVHGNPGPLDDWEAIAPAVAAFARVIALDMPGFGRADRPRSFDFTVDGYARYLGAALDALQVRRAHLVLHDFGGPWGARWAVDHADALASITLINTAICPEFEWHFFARVWQTPVLAELLHAVSGKRLISAIMNRDNPRPLPRSFTDRVTGYYDWAQARAVDKLYRAARDPRATFGPLAAGLRALDPPACIIWGADDKYVPAKLAKLHQQLFSRSELHLLAGCGHWPFIDEPERVRDIVCGFLRRQLARSQEHAAL